MYRFPVTYTGKRQGIIKWLCLCHFKKYLCNYLFTHMQVLLVFMYEAAVLRDFFLIVLQLHIPQQLIFFLVFSFYEIFFLVVQGFFYLPFPSDLFLSYLLVEQWFTRDTRLSNSKSESSAENKMFFSTRHKMYNILFCFHI